MLPLFALVWGGLFGVITWSLSAVEGVAVVTVSVLLVAVPLLCWSRVRQRTRWMFGLTFGLALYFQLTFLCVGLAALSTLASAGVVVAVGLVTVGLVAARLPRDVRRFDAEWETHRAANEREVLDLEAGTYDLDRRFAPLTGGGQGRVIAGARDAAELAARSAPLIAIAATTGAVLAAHGVSDFRIMALAVLGPFATVAFTGALAQAVVQVRRLHGYERRLGRPILNR